MPTIKEFTHAAPDVYQSLVAFGAAIEASGLEKPLIELVKIRASQINGCTYCAQYHINLGRKLGVSLGQLDQLATWRESPFFSERERAALSWTERLTHQAGHLPTAADRAKLREQFGDKEITYLSACIGLINGWNRINVALGTLPPDAV
jgi:AhpD family alkylhydroperoxidase